MMNRYNLEETLAFERRLRETREYRTADGPPARNWGPLEGLRAAYFHARILRVYAVARKMIRKGVFDRDGYLTRSWKSLDVTESAGGRFEVSGLARLAATSGPVVIIGNHMSSLETIILPGLILPFKDVAFVVKKSLTVHPVFGPIMCSVKHIAVGRDNPREDLKRVLSQGSELIQQGVSVVIFPQATRSVEFDIEGFNSLGVKLAVRTGVPVVPLALKTDFMANGKWIKDMGKVHPERTIHFEFGESFKVSGNGREEHAAMVRFVASRLQQWGGTVKGVIP
jgi:1-acyl-sn-glycerol-3-phosphate acyltransferase